MDKMLTGLAVAVLLASCVTVAPHPQADAANAPRPGKAAAAQPATPPVQPQAAPSASPRPVLLIEQADLNIGEVKEGGEGVATFRLQNTGDAELKILAARPG